jgi:hypothetical protein
MKLRRALQRRAYDRGNRMRSILIATAGIFALVLSAPVYAQKTTSSQNVYITGQVNPISVSGQVAIGGSTNVVETTPLANLYTEQLELTSQASLPQQNTVYTAQTYALTSIVVALSASKSTSNERCYVEFDYIGANGAWDARLGRVEVLEGQTQSIQLQYAGIVVPATGGIRVRMVNSTALCNGAFTIIGRR